ALGVGMKPYLTFESGGARFAVEAIKVHATVPRRAIEQNSLTSGSCLGSIVHHGRRIPVLNSNDVIGLGSHKDLTTSEIVVLRFPEGRTVGLAVEVIKRISMLDEACETLASASIRSATRFIRATFSNEDAVQSYLIDIAEMHGDTELLNMANLSEIDAPKPSLKRSQGGAPMPDDVVEEAKRYLVVRFGERLALPLTQVVRILAPPESFTPIVAGGMGLTGYCSIDGVSTPLFLAEDLLGSGGGKTRHTSRVVLAGPPDARFGLVVDEVESIETSSWRKDAASPSQFKSGLVDLKSSNGSRVLEWADLDRLGARLTERSLELTG
ncbi:MAG: chemotaxis protein CheW, partial [Pseudomonadota bacterium]